MFRHTDQSRKHDLQKRRDAAFQRRFQTAMRAPRRYL